MVNVNQLEIKDHSVGMGHGIDNIKYNYNTRRAHTTGKHNISHNEAVNSGKPLRYVLKMMLAEIFEYYTRGGRIVPHHLEFGL